MKTLDLNAYGVQEMNNLEVMEIDGGAWGTAVREVVKAITSGAIYDTAKVVVNTAVAVVSSIKYDPAVNYTPWAGPVGGGFK